jgi:alanine dehydrogenase
LAKQLTQGTVAIGPEGVSRLLPMQECIGVMELMFRDAPALKAQPPRVIDRVDKDSAILAMPSYSHKLRRYSVKIVTEFKRNPELFGIPAQGGITLLLSGKSAEVLALIDSASLTAVRTGAVSGLATKILSRKDSSVVGIIGSGEQARTQYEAVCAVRSVEAAKVYSAHPSNARRFATEMTRRTGVRTTQVTEVRGATHNADIIIAATNSAIPVLQWDEVPAGSHINSVGTLPDRVELAPEIISNASVYADTRDGVLREAGDVIKAIKNGLFSPEGIVADLAELCKDGGLGRKSDDQVTLFKSVGFALQDLYVASYMYDKVSAHPRAFTPGVWSVELPRKRMATPSS